MLQLGLQGLGHFRFGLGLLYVDGEEALDVGLLQSDVVALDEAALVDLSGIIVLRFLHRDCLSFKLTHCRRTFFQVRKSMSKQRNVRSQGSRDGILLENAAISAAILSLHQYHQHAFRFALRIILAKL